MTVQVAIEARAVSHRSRVGEISVRDVSMTIGQGELVAIIGGRGTGKSALLDALSGLLSPSSGTVLRSPQSEDQPSADQNGAAVLSGSTVRRQIGYVPVGETIHPVLPLGRALRYSAELRGVVSPGENGDGDLDDALRAVNLSGKARVPVGDLNPGERKRAAIAAELLGRPEQLFLDDPTASLDPAQAMEVLRLLRRLSDDGMTVVLTTTSAMDADRCDKVALLATGGHLAFYGTPAAARGYFGADSLEEIYERLVGLGDPAAAWSRRFYQFPRTRGSAPVPTMPRAPGPAVLVPDAAGPHSAGRPSLPFVDDAEPEDRGTQEPEHAQPTGSPRPLRQLPVLIRRNAEALARSRQQQGILAVVPLAILLVFCVLLGVGALDGPAAVTLAWAVLGSLVTGLAYGLPKRAPEAGMLRRERFAGVSVPVFLAAKAALLVPALAAASLIILAVPASAARLQAGFEVSYLAVFAASLIGLAAAAASIRPSQEE